MKRIVRLIFSLVFLFGQANVYAGEINLAADKSVIDGAITKTQDTQAEFEGTAPNDAKGFGYTTTRHQGKIKTDGLWDDFEDGVWDTSIWDPSTLHSGFEEANGKLKMYNEGTATAKSILFQRLIPSGDVDIQMDYSGLQTAAGTGQSFEFVFDLGGGDMAEVIINNTGRVWGRVRVSGNYLDSGSSFEGYATGKVRLQRAGNTIYMCDWTGSTWRTLYSYTSSSFANLNRVSFFVWAAGGSNILIYVDNFKIIPNTYLDTSLYRSPRFDLRAKTKLSSADLVKNTPPAGTDMKVYLRSGDRIDVDTDNIAESVLRDTSKEEFEEGTDQNIVIGIDGTLKSALSNDDPTSAMLSQSGLSAFIATAVVDNAINSAWHTDTSSAGAWLRIDLGAGNEKGYVRARIYAGTSGYAGNYSIQYSDDDATWINAATGFFPSSAGWNEKVWSSVGSHRYWRLYLTNTPGSGPWLCELELYRTFLPQTFTSSSMDLGFMYPGDLLVLQADIPTGTQISVDARAGNTASPDASWTAWDTATTFSPDGSDPNILVHSIGVSGAYRHWQYRINGTTDGNRAWIVRDVFLIPQPGGENPNYSRLIRIDDGFPSSETESFPAGRYFQYLVLGASNGSAVWELNKIDLASRFSALDLGKCYQVASISMADSNSADILYRLHTTIANTSDYTSILDSQWEDLEIKNTSTSISKSFPPSGKALRWLRVNRINDTNPGTSETTKAVAQLAAQPGGETTGIYHLRSQDNNFASALAKTGTGNESEYVITIDNVVVGGTSPSKEFRIYAGSKAISNLSIRTAQAGTSDGHQYAELSWASASGFLTSVESQNPGLTGGSATPGTAEDHKAFYIRTNAPAGTPVGDRQVRLRISASVME